MRSMANRLCLLVLRGLVGIAHAVSRPARIWAVVRQRCSFVGALASVGRLVRLTRMACHYAAGEAHVTRSDTPCVSIAMPSAAVTRSDTPCVSIAMLSAAGIRSDTPCVSIAMPSVAGGRSDTPCVSIAMPSAAGIRSDTPCVSFVMPGDARWLAGWRIKGVALLRGSHAGRGSTANPQSIPSFFSLYRNARKVMPNCAAVRVLFQRFSSSAFWIAVRSICSM